MPPQPSLCEALAAAARQAGVFGDVTVTPTGLLARPQGQADAVYFVELGAPGSAADPGPVPGLIPGAEAWVGLATPDRWLSESIEADLMHTGDKLEEMLEEELIDQGLPKPALGLKVEHFRDDQKRYIFRTCFAETNPLRLAAVLLAYQATFSRLGNLAPREE